MVKRPRRTVLLLLLALVSAAALAQAQEPTPVRLSDAVGDTIDLAERNSFRLFPNTAGFQRATILALPGPEFFAQVARADGDATEQVFYRIMPGDLQRIRFLVNNHVYVDGQQQSDSTVVPSLASFWQAIEEQPLPDVPGKPAQTQEVTRVPAKAAAADNTSPRPATNCENRYACTVHGATLGSIAGGCIGSHTGYTLIEPGHYEETECFRIYIPPLYRVDLAGLLLPSIGATVVGAVAGYAFGSVADRKPATASLAQEDTRWRTGCAGASVLPAIALGVLAGTAAHGTIFGRERDPNYKIENDPDGLSAIPSVLTGLCVSVEVVTFGYLIGRMIDRNKAREARH